MNFKIENSINNSQEKEKSSFLVNYLDKIFFTLTLLYLALVLFWHNQPKQTIPYSIKQTSKNSVSNAQFIAYLKQSIKVIEQTPLQVTSLKPKPQNTPFEKVYVPLPPSVNETIPVPPKPVKVTSIPVPPKPVKVTSIPVPPKPSKVISTGPSVTIAPLSLPSDITPSANIMLTGVLESGSNSAALFSFKGITKRLQIGDPVGSSGWVFKGVVQQRAVLSKGEQNRYIEVGQRF